MLIGLNYITFHFQLDTVYQGCQNLFSKDYSSLDTFRKFDGGHKDYCEK